MVGDLSLTGELSAVGGLEPKFAAAAKFALKTGLDKAYIIFPSGNVNEKGVVESDGRPVRLSRQLRQVLVLLPVAREVEALKLLFPARFGAYA